MTVKEWREKAKETLEAVSEGDSPGAVMNYLTSATIELMTQIIGEDEPVEYSEETVWQDEKYKETRNQVRANLRQSLKEMKGE